MKKGPSSKARSLGTNRSSPRRFTLLPRPVGTGARRSVALAFCPASELSSMNLGRTVRPHNLSEAWWNPKSSNEDLICEQCLPIGEDQPQESHEEPEVIDDEEGGDGNVAQEQIG